MLYTSLTQFAVIFDMDGVLLDSPRLNWQANNEVLARHGVAVPTDEFVNYLGTTLEDTVNAFNIKYNLDLNYKVFKAETDAIKKTLFADITPKEGVVDLLRVLKDEHVPIAVATSMPRHLTEQRLKNAGILNMFDVLVTEDDVTRHKPDPEVFLKAAELLNVAPEHAVVFEDAPAGVAAANAAGVICIAVKTPFVPRNRLQNATNIINSLANITLSELRALVA